MWQRPTSPSEAKPKAYLKATPKKSKFFLGGWFVLKTADTYVSVWLQALRLARGQVQLKIIKGPGSAPGFFEDQAPLKTFKRRPTPLKKNFDFFGCRFSTYTRECPALDTSEHKPNGKRYGKTADIKRLVGNNFRLVGKASR